MSLSAPKYPSAPQRALHGSQRGAQQINTEFPEELKFLGSKQGWVWWVPSPWWWPWSCSSPEGLGPVVLWGSRECPKGERVPPSPGHPQTAREGERVELLSLSLGCTEVKPHFSKGMIGAEFAVCCPGRFFSRFLVGLANTEVFVG